MKKVKVVFSILCIAAILSGCTARLGDFTLISTKNLELSRMGEFKRGAQRARGEDVMLMIVFIPNKLNPNMKDAIDRAIESVPGGVALVDVVLYSELFIIPILLARTSFIIEGTPLIDPKLKASLPSNYMVSKYDETKDNFVTTYVSKDEYEALKHQLTGS